jgi:hypothetical protein
LVLGVTAVDAAARATQAARQKNTGARILTRAVREHERRMRAL